MEVKSYGKSNYEMKSIVCDQYMDHEEYKVRSAAGAFLQCNCKDYLLVEFWGRDIQPFVDFVNKQPEFMD